MSRIATAVLASTLLLGGVPMPSDACTGDCDSNGRVDIHELVRMVNIALGVQTLDACSVADASGDGLVRINEMVLAVGNALKGCPATPPPTTEPTATPPPSGATIEIGSAAGVPGGTVEIEVRLVSNTSVAATENDIFFGPGVFVPEVPIGSRTCRRNGSPCVTDADCNGECKIEDCEVNPALAREESIFVFVPGGCTPGVDCTGLSTLVAMFGNITPIPNGAVLYTCRVQIAEAAQVGNFTLRCSGPGAVDPNGNSVPTGCVHGSVQVRGGLAPTDTSEGAPAADRRR